MMELCTLRLISSNLPIHSKLAAPKHIQSLFPCRTRSPFIPNHSRRFTSGWTYCVNSPLSSTTSEETSTKTSPYDTDKPETDGVVTAGDANADEKKEGFYAQPNEADKLESDGGVIAEYSPREERKEDSVAKLYEADQLKTDKLESAGEVKAKHIQVDEQKEDSGAKLYEADKPKTDSVATVENTSLDERKEDFATLLNEVPQEVALPDLQLSKFLEDLGIKIDYEENKYSILAIGGGALIALWLTSGLVGAIDSIPLFPKVMELIGLGYSIWFSIRYLIFEESREELIAKIGQLKQEVLGSGDD